MAPPADLLKVFSPEVGSCHRLGKSYAGRQHRASIAGPNFKAAADLSKPFLHSEYSESDFPHATRHSRRGGSRHASAKIFDLQDHSICLSFQTNNGIETPRMAEDIRESFLRDAKKMSVHFHWQAPNLWPRFKFNVDVVLLHEVFDVLAQTSRKAEPIEYRRVQSMREGEDPFPALLTQHVALCEYELDFGRPRSPLLQTLEVDVDRGNVLGSHFMKFGGDRPPLFILLFKNVSR